MPHMQLQAGSSVGLCNSPHCCSFAQICKVDVPCHALPRWAKVAVLCCAVLCCAVLCCAVLCCAVLCCAVLTTLRCAVPGRAVLFHAVESCAEQRAD